MKKIILFFIIIISTSLLAANFSLDYFSARSDGRNISVEWRPQNENNLNYFEIERSSDKISFFSISSIKAKGAGNTYKYIDEQAFSSANSSGNQTNTQMTYNYRIKAVYNDNNFIYSESTSVIQNLNSVKRTWGMLKEMFR